MDSVLNKDNITRWLTNAATVGIINEAFVDKGKMALMDSAYMGVASAMTDILGTSNPLAKESYFGTQAMAFSDSVFYALIEMIRKDERNVRDAFQNFLIGMGGSFIGSTFAPIISRGVGMVPDGSGSGSGPVPSQQTASSQRTVVGHGERIVRSQTRGGVTGAVVNY